MIIPVKYPAETGPEIGRIVFTIVQGAWQYQPVYTALPDGGEARFSKITSEEAARRLLLAYYGMLEARKAQETYLAALRHARGLLTQASMLRVGNYNGDWLRSQERLLEEVAEYVEENRL
jgi:hypothetical protein